MGSLNYLPITQFLPIDNSDDDRWSRFTKPEMDEVLYSLVAKIWVNGELETRVHRSFVNAMQEVTNRKGVRGQDYVIFSLWRDGQWHIHARIDWHFISEEDVINE